MEPYMILVQGVKIKAGTPSDPPRNSAERTFTGNRSPLLQTQGRPTPNSRASTATRVSNLMDSCPGTALGMGLEHDALHCRGAYLPNSVGQVPREVVTHLPRYLTPLVRYLGRWGPSGVGIQGVRYPEKGPPPPPLHTQHSPGNQQ